MYARSINDFLACTPRCTFFMHAHTVHRARERHAWLNVHAAFAVHSIVSCLYLYKHQTGRVYATAPPVSISFTTLCLCAGCVCVSEWVCECAWPDTRSQYMEGGGGGEWMRYVAFWRSRVCFCPERFRVDAPAMHAVYTSCISANTIISRWRARHTCDLYAEIESGWRVQVRDAWGGGLRSIIASARARYEFAPYAALNTTSVQRWNWYTYPIILKEWVVYVWIMN